MTKDEILAHFMQYNGMILMIKDAVWTPFGFTAPTMAQLCYYFDADDASAIDPEKAVPEEERVPLTQEIYETCAELFRDGALAELDVGPEDGRNRRVWARPELIELIKNRLARARLRMTN